MNGRDDQKLQVKEATDLVSLIGQDLALKRKGKEFVALCPFHDDKNPSMSVVPQKQIYHCFVCKAGGDVFNWMMNYHKMDFPQALEHLADRAGIQLKPLGSPAGGRRSIGADGLEVIIEDQGPSQRKRLLATNDLAQGFFRSTLSDPQRGATVRKYIEQRGISSEMVEQFKIGYAADSWDDLVATIRREGWDVDAFEMGGLVSLRVQPRDRRYTSAGAGRRCL